MGDPLDPILAAGLPRLVIFDIDGTLTDTGIWWPPLARRSVAALAAELGMTLPAPDDNQANSLLGLSGDDLWAGLLPASAKAQWKRLRAITLPLEGEVLREGTDHTFPGTCELLTFLRENGVAIALASNCGLEYLQGVLEGQGIGPLVDRSWCAESPGISCKADMVAAALAEFKTRDAVLVGDRVGDFEAAKAHDLPFILRTGWHQEGDLPAEAVAGSQDEIGLWLSARGTFLKLLLSRLESSVSMEGAAGEAAGLVRDRSPIRVGLTGPPGGSKSLFAAALARAMGARALRDHSLGARAAVIFDLDADAGGADAGGQAPDAQGPDLPSILVDVSNLLRPRFLSDPRSTSP